MAANRALEDMLHLAARLVPGLRAEVASREHARPAQAFVHARPAPRGDDGNRAALDALLTYWSHAYPEAGRAYWSSRCWGILIWQPLYLSVIGVHASGAALSLQNIEQPIADGWTSEVRLRDHAPLQGETSALIEHAAREIAACCAQMHDELAPVIRLNTVAVRGTQADVVLAALLAARKARPEWSDAQVESLGRQWLGALGLEGLGGYFAFECANRARALALDRRTCCYHFRRRDGEMCSTCPRLTRQARIERLQAQHDAALEA